MIRRHELWRVKPESLSTAAMSLVTMPLDRSVSQDLTSGDGRFRRIPVGSRRFNFVKIVITM
jgi:hypothetical protein